ncbi:8277_t:CDS:1, partial [Gigaspora rosea]
MAPQNRGKSSGNPRCPKCGLHYKDIHGHVKRIHNTTLSILKLQVNGKRNQNVQYQDNRTRQDRRNDRLYNRSHLIKQIDGYLRILRSQKRNAPKEDELIFDDKIQWFNKLKESARTANEDDLSFFQSIYSDFNSIKKKSDDEIKW